MGLKILSHWEAGVVKHLNKTPSAEEMDLAKRIQAEWLANPGMAGEPDLQTRIAQALCRYSAEQCAKLKAEVDRLTSIANMAQLGMDKYAAELNQLKAELEQMRNATAENYCSTCNTAWPNHVSYVNHRCPG